MAIWVQVAMAYFCRFNCFVFYMSLILSCSLVISKACKTKQQIPSTLDGPFQPKTVQFDPGLRRGSDDLPPSDPRLTRKKPSKYPEQISLALSSPGSMWVSWITGDAQLGSVVTPLDPCSMSSTVLYGTDSGKYTFSINGSAFVYSQIYPFEGLLNYTSGIIHHVRLEGMAENWELSSD